MARRYMLSLCLSGLLLLPASLALACHLERVSIDLSCTQYKFAATAVGAPHKHSIRYNFVLTPANGGTPITVSRTIPVNGASDTSMESVTGSLNLAGTYGAQSFSGTASLISDTGDTENTVAITLSPKTLNCSQPPQS